MGRPGKSASHGSGRVGAPAHIVVVVVVVVVFRARARLYPVAAMAGLRRINNTYMPTGQGRDTFILQDHSWRSGKSGFGNSRIFLPKVTACHGKQLRQAGGSLGPAAAAGREDFSRQHLNLSRSSHSITRERKERLFDSTGSSFASTQSSSMPGLPGTPTLSSRAAQKEFVPLWDVKPMPDSTARAWASERGAPAVSLDLGPIVAASSILSPAGSSTGASFRKPMKGSMGASRKPDGGFWTSYV